MCAWAHAQLFSWIQLFVTPWTIAHQAPLSMGFSRQDYWIGLPFPSPGDLPDPGIKPTSLTSSALEGRFFTPLPPGKPELSVGIFICKWNKWTVNNLCRKDRWINNQSQGYGTKDIHFLFIDIYFHAPALNTSIPRGESRIYRPICSPIPRDRIDSSDFNITYMVMTLTINISSPN